MNKMLMLERSIQRVYEEDLQVFKNAGVSDDDYTVIHDEKAYNVSVIEDRIVACSCPHSVYRKTVCKHMIKVSYVTELEIAGI